MTRLSSRINATPEVLSRLARDNGYPKKPEYWNEVSRLAVPERNLKAESERRPLPNIYRKHLMVRESSRDK